MNLEQAIARNRAYHAAVKILRRAQNQVRLENEDLAAPRWRLAALVSDKLTRAIRSLSTNSKIT